MERHRSVFSRSFSPHSLILFERKSLPFCKHTVSQNVPMTSSSIMANATNDFISCIPLVRSRPVRWFYAKRPLGPFMTAGIANNDTTGRDLKLKSNGIVKLRVHWSLQCTYNESHINTCVTYS